MNTTQMLAKSMTTNKITTDKTGFHVSYNPSSRDYGCATTALYIEETSQFLILCGKHKYEDCETLDDHLEYFYANVDQANHRSEHGMVFDYAKSDYVKGGY